MGNFQRWESRSVKNSNLRKTRYACILEDHEPSTRRIEKAELPVHEDFIAEQGFISLNHRGSALKPTPIPQGMKIPFAKTAVEKKWSKLEKLPAW